MSRISTFVLGPILAAACVAAAPALAMPLSGLPGAGPYAAPLVIQVEKKSPIDPSCLMVCTKWVGDNCEKFEMKCKGDPGYPTANQATQGTTSGTTGTADPGSTGTQGIKGRPNVKGNAATKGN
jgi:hypothetical protein